MKIAMVVAACVLVLMSVLGFLTSAGLGMAELLVFNVCFVVLVVGAVVLLVNRRKT